MKGIVIAFWLLVFPASAMAADYICGNDGMTRTISVEYDSEGAPVPCKVRYDKPDEGGVQYPWSARNQVGFCEQRAAELAERLNSFGWNCERQEPVIGETGEMSSDAGMPDEAAGEEMIMEMEPEDTGNDQP